MKKLTKEEIEKLKKANIKKAKLLDDEKLIKKQSWNYLTKANSVRNQI